jgi:hypothetical protein
MEEGEENERKKEKERKKQRERKKTARSEGGSKDQTHLAGCAMGQSQQVQLEAGLRVSF